MASGDTSELAGVASPYELLSSRGASVAGRDVGWALGVLQWLFCRRPEIGWFLPRSLSRLQNELLGGLGTSAVPDCAGGVL